MIHAGQRPSDGFILFAVAMSMISLSLTIGFLTFGKRRPTEFASRTIEIKDYSFSMAQAFALFMTFWWGLGAFLLTVLPPRPRHAPPPRASPSTLRLPRVHGALTPLDQCRTHAVWVCTLGTAGGQRDG